MNEHFLQYLWQHKLYTNKSLATTDGKPVTVHYHGDLNTNAGPDFFNAKVAIGDTLWAGNIEIHTNSNHWYLHGHHKDKSYNNVILHVVQESASSTVSENGSAIPTLCIDPPSDIEESYLQFLNSNNAHPCIPHIKTLDAFELRFWLEKLISQRLEHHYKQICSNLDQTKNDWKTAFYHLFAQAFGTQINKPAFLLVAQLIPRNVIEKLKNNVFQLEAVLFGTANLLTAESNCDYETKLWDEYMFLKRKFSLTPIPKEIWKFSKLRPHNSPFLRLAQLAAVLHDQKNLFSACINIDDSQLLAEKFKCSTSTFWHDHYNFNSSSKHAQKSISSQFRNHLLINVAVPIKFAYGLYTHDHLLQENAISILEKLPPENNTITKQWEEAGIIAESASDSQAIIELNNLYCKRKKCLHCSIGNKIIREKIRLRHANLPHRQNN